VLEDQWKKSALKKGGRGHGKKHYLTFARTMVHDIGGGREQKNNCPQSELKK